jgi:uncharacterized membrane protein (DUF485 family)
MATPTAPRPGESADAGPEVPGYDWEALEHTPEFQELIHKKKAFVLPATIFFLSYYMAFILLCGYAQDFMGSSVYQGLTVGYVLALTQFVMVLVLGLMYLKFSNDAYDPLRERVIEMAERTTAERGRAGHESAAPGGPATTSGETPR